MMFQKKEEEQAPIKLTDKEIKTIKEKLSQKEDLDLKIKDLKMPDIMPQAFNGTIVDIKEGKQLLFLADNMTGLKFKNFKKSVGGMFNKDVLAFRRGQKHGKYVLIEGKEVRKIVRLIEDEELFLFQTFKLVNGIIKDKPYMLIKNLAPKEKLTCSNRYVENEDEYIETEVMSTETVVVQVEDDNDVHTTSVSLFDK